MVPDVPNQTASDLRPVGIRALNLTSFGRGPNNRLYITQTTGELSRIAPAVIAARLAIDERPA